MERMNTTELRARLKASALARSAGERAGRGVAARGLASLRLKSTVSCSAGVSLVWGRS